MDDVTAGHATTASLEPSNHFRQATLDSHLPQVVNGVLLRRQLRCTPCTSTGRGGPPQANSTTCAIPILALRDAVFSGERPTPAARQRLGVLASRMPPHASPVRLPTSAGRWASDGSGMGGAVAARVSRVARAVR